MSAAKSDSYEWIGPGTEHEKAFRDGVKRHGQAQTVCPVCGGHRLHRRDASGYCDLHRSWSCFTSLRVACHDCKLRWGVVVRKCGE